MSVTKPFLYTVAVTEFIDHGIVTHCLQNAKSFVDNIIFEDFVVQ